MDHITSSPTTDPTAGYSMPGPGMPPPIIIQAPKPSFFQGLRNQFLVGAFLHCLSFFFNFWSVIPFILAAILGLVGWKVMPPKAVAEKVKGAGHRIEEVLGGIDGKVGIIPHFKTPEQVAAEAARKEADRKHKEESEIRMWQAKADAIKFSYDKDWTVEKYRVEVPLAEKRVAQLARDEEQRRQDEERRKEEQEQRRLWIDRATKVGFGVNPDLPLKEMKKQVEEAEAYVKADEAYQLAHRRWEEAMEDYRRMLARGPNARCPDRRCNFAFRVHTTNTMRSAMCVSCKYVAARMVFLAQWKNPPAPKEPAPPTINPGMVGRIKRFLR
jgi:hypothetical protein